MGSQAVIRCLLEISFGVKTCMNQRLLIHKNKKIKNDNNNNRNNNSVKFIRNNADNTIDNRMTITRKQKWKEKQLYGRFKTINKQHIT